MGDQDRGKEDTAAEAPFWNTKDHSLFWRGQLIKHFAGDAPDQEAVLRAFQRRNWDRCIRVPRTWRPKPDPKKWLHDTVKNLNRSVRPWLKFRQEGNGSRLRWETLP